MIGAPLLWAGASPVLVHNLVLMAGFALTGWTACLVIRRWTGSWMAGIGSGSLVAFNAFSLTRLPQIQDLHVEFFPLALLALDRLLSEPRVRHALSLAGWFVLHSLTGTYVMVFAEPLAGCGGAGAPCGLARRAVQNGGGLRAAGCAGGSAAADAIPAALLPGER